MSPYGRSISSTAAEDGRGNGLWNGAIRICARSGSAGAQTDAEALAGSDGARFLSLFCPDIVAERLPRLIEWCDRYSPLVSQDGSDGVILDITGCAHLLFKAAKAAAPRSPAPSASNEGRISRGHRRAHGAPHGRWRGTAINSSFSGENVVSALDPLPVEALRLPHEMVLELRSLGLFNYRRGAEDSTPSLTRDSAPLFSGVWTRLFKSGRSVNALASSRAVSGSRMLAEPISTVFSVEHVLQEMLREVCDAARKEPSWVRGAWILRATAWMEPWIDAKSVPRSPCAPFRT